VTKEALGIPLSCQPACPYDKSRCVKNFRLNENFCDALEIEIKEILSEQRGADILQVRFRSPEEHIPAQILISDKQKPKPNDWKEVGYIKAGFFIPTSG